jgi:hypothetical protein
VHAVALGGVADAWARRPKILAAVQATVRHRLIGLCLGILMFGGSLACKSEGGSQPGGDGGGSGSSSRDASIDHEKDASSGGGTAGTGSATQDAAAPAADSGSDPTPGDCPGPAPNQPPETLSCTGMYSDIVAKNLANGVSEFAPAIALWSDGAEKTRWVFLPAGEQIDISDADAWKFPVGTKFWKEFKWSGKRVETRMFWKVSPFFWARTAYRWNDTETEATRTGGEDVTVDGDAYHIPSTTECDQCHKGRLDRALGFEALLLGLPGATGMNLAKLDTAGRLTGGSVPTGLAIGDDGTGHASAALGFLHVNCGVSCHNGNPAAEAYSTGLRLRLRVAQADGRAPTGFDTLTTTLGVDATTGRWLGDKRIVEGSAADSLLYTLMSTRDPTNMKDQMPPIASRIVPKDGAAFIKAWIDAR